MRHVVSGRDARNGIHVHHRGSRSAVRWPLRDAGSIGVGVLDEIDPPPGGDPHYLSIGIVYEPGQRIERVKDVRYFTGMKSACIAT